MTIGAYGSNAYMNNAYMHYSQKAAPGAERAGYSRAPQNGQPQVPAQYGQQQYGPLSALSRYAQYAAQQNTAQPQQAPLPSQSSIIPQLQPSQTPLPGSNAFPASLFQNADGDRAEISMPKMPGSGLLDSLKPEGECQTCANRKYVDGSDDASVSYQTPTNISPNMAGAAVAAHEQEHVRNEQANAQRNGRQIVSQTVTLHYDTCPECGKNYVSGGTTRTMSTGKKENPLTAGKPEEGNSANAE